MINVTTDQEDRHHHSLLSVLKVITTVNSSWWGEGSFHLTGSGSSLREARSGTQGKLEAGTEAEAMEECCLLLSYLWIAQPPFL